jgi:hypothetical protein
MEVEAETNLQNIVAKKNELNEMTDEAITNLRNIEANYNAKKN